FEARTWDRRLGAHALLGVEGGANALAEHRQRAFAADVHEVDARFGEEEVVVERGDLDARIEQRAHYGVYLVLEKDEVAHDHRLDSRFLPGNEADPGGKPHERRHVREAVDFDGDVVARERDLHGVARRLRRAPGQGSNRVRVE